MELTIKLVGEETKTLEFHDDATVADVVEPLAVTLHEVSVMVNGRTLPEDAPIPANTDTVRVVRLIKGG